MPHRRQPAKPAKPDHTLEELMAVSGRLQEQSADIAQRLAELADAIERKAKEERERTSSK